MKETFIGGDFTQNIGGSNKVYVKDGYTISGKNVIFNADGAIIHGEPDNAPPQEIPAKCAVQFRPKVNWKGEDYGFDWMRVDELTNMGCVFYEDIVANQYKDSGFTTLESDPNEYGGYFKTSASMFGNLRDEYGVRSIPWKKKVDGTLQDYYLPWLSVYPSKIKDEKTGELIPSGFSNTKALLSLLVDVFEEPFTLKIEENPHFKITPLEITPKTKGLHNLEDYITIECVEDFTEDQIITVYAISKDSAGNEKKDWAGAVQVWANDATKRKKAKMLLVNVKTSSTIVGSNIGQEDLFKKYLNQCLIEGVLETYSLDVSADANIKIGGKYRNGNRINAYYEDESQIPPNFASGYIPLIYYLNGKLQDELRSRGENIFKYSKYFVAFYIGENGGGRDKFNAYKPVNGFASQNFVMLFSNKSDETGAHEFLHTKKIPHSFKKSFADANAKYTYIFAMTDNLMDYSHLETKPRFSLWKWQWQNANTNTINL